MANRCHLRSISLPSRSHPIILKIQEELNKLRTLEVPSASLTLGEISNSLPGLEQLYKCMDELLGLPSTQEAISLHEHESLDESIILIDICGTARDVVSQFKENIRDLQSVLRRRKGDVCIESSINKYISSRRKMSKDAKKLLGVIKRMHNKVGASSLSDQDRQLCTVIRVLREVNMMSISIFRSLSLLFSAPVLLKSRSSRWSLVSKLMYEGVVASEVKHQNILLENVDTALGALSTEGAHLEKMQLASKELKALETSIEGLNNCLESMFRRLIKTRASLLNTISY